MRKKRNQNLRIESLDPVPGLGDATIASIPVARIAIDDRTHCVRQDVTPVGAPDSYIVTRGTVDLTGGHPAAFERIGDLFRPVSGFRRLLVVLEHTNAKRVLSFVIDEGDPIAVFIAARINLEHGEPLSCAEKFECFRRELNARQDAGLPRLSDRAWARIYQLSRSTPGNWICQIRANHQPGRSNTRVRIGHPTRKSDSGSRNRATRPSVADVPRAKWKGETPRSSCGRCGSCVNRETRTIGFPLMINGRGYAEGVDSELEQRKHGH